MITFDLVEEVQEGDHTFAVYDCRDGDDTSMLDVLIELVRELYVDPERLQEVLTAAMNDAAGVVDPDAINEAIQRTLAAAIPEPGTHPIPHLDVARNELAEALAHVALAELHGTVIPAPRIRNKEVPKQPARGRDLLGLDDDPLVAVIGEIKASSEAASPPAVVGSGDNSIRAEFLTFLSIEDAVLTELNWALKHAKPEHHGLIARAILAHVANNLPLCAAPVLVRPAAHRGADDFGTFRDNPGEFAPARVRFSILTVDEELDALAKTVYDGARA